MAIIAESWSSIAHTLGYVDESEMLRDLYVLQNWSLTDISRKLGYSTGNVRKRLILNGFMLRKRGGKNRTGQTLLRSLPNIELADAKACAAKYGVHLSTVFGERRRRGMKGRRTVDAIRDDSTVGVSQEDSGTA